MLEIRIINKIPVKIEEYQSKTGATKAWICRQMGYNSRQAFEKAMKNASNSVETYIRFAEFLKCDFRDLFENVMFQNDDN